ncbi:MAG: selenoprotein B glycine/betaine/sarcosine/D-proline reductase [Acetobacteraceae bacterium]|nr:selenoprotein B glycine/betaine/sarcosine/D-proline reductase [Acetobacteraceae bacterium]
MARLDDIPEPTRTAARDIPCPRFTTTPFVVGPALSERRIAIISSAALIRRGDTPFSFGSGEYRAVPGSWDTGDILVSHVSTNFDRAGFQRDVNVVYPLDRLREMEAEGAIGSVAGTHYTVMGSTDPDTMQKSADGIAAALHADHVTGVLLAPV